MGKAIATDALRERLRFHLAGLRCAISLSQEFGCKVACALSETMCITFLLIGVDWIDAFLHVCDRRLCSKSPRSVFYKCVGVMGVRQLICS